LCACAVAAQAADAAPGAVPAAAPGAAARRLLRFRGGGWHGGYHTNGLRRSISMQYHAVRRAAYRPRFGPRTPYLRSRPDPCRNNMQDPMCLAQFWSRRAAAAAQVKPSARKPSARKSGAGAAAAAPEPRPAL
jgi:hypothetical protein